MFGRTTCAVLIVVGISLGCSSRHEVVKSKFENDGITFSANLYKPIGSGPFPAVVMVHGSKNHTKDFYTEYSEYFADNGVVVLNYDNRGHGESGGDLWTATFIDLAKDVVAALEHLQSLGFVDPNKVGVWADSHGGWIVLIADSLSNNVDFIINKSGPAVTPLETVRFDVERNYLDPERTPENETKRILDLYRPIFEYLTRNRSDSLWGLIKRELNYFEPTPYFKNEFDVYYKELLVPPSKMVPIDELPIAPSGRDYDFDPRPYVEGLETRMLLIYGTADELIPAMKSADIVRGIDNPNIQLKVYDGADHGIRTHRRPEILLKPIFPEGYLESLVEFIKK